MTNEEAIKVITEQLSYSDDVLPARLKEAYEVAIDEFKAIKEGVVFYSNRPIEDIVLEARADAIEEFKDRLLELCDCGIEQADCTGGNCYKCLDNQVDYSSIVDLAEELMEKMEMTEWIPCNERMPENNKRVLVTILQKGDDGDPDSYLVEAATYFNKEFIGSEMNDLELFDEVIAWMPCIEPYKMQTETL